MTEDRAAEPAEPVEPAQPEGEGDVPDPVLTALGGWQHHLAGLGGPNTLLWYRDLPSGTVDLSTAHPGGLAMLLAGRQTRLSDLVREHEAFARARERARRIREKSSELREERGLEVCYLALGVASWRLPGGRVPAAPVLLRACTLTPTGPAHRDYTIDLADDVEVNPALVEYLRGAEGIDVDPAGLARRATVAGGFYPGPVYSALRQSCRDVDGFDITPRLVVSTFPHAKMAAVADLASGRAALAGHPVVAALAGDTEARKALAGDRGPGDAGPAGEDPDADGIPPALDADPYQRPAIDAVRRGTSLVIDAPPGTGRSRTVANLVAALAGEGKRVLLVAEKRAALAAVRSMLAEEGLDDLVLAVEDGAGTDRRVLAELADAAGREEPVPVADMTETDRALVATRERLHDHVEALHRVREPWGVTAHELQEDIARLARRPRPPRTRVRLTGDTLAAVDHGRLDALAEQLLAVARAGAWDPAVADDPWYGARVTSAAEAEVARQVCERLIDGGLARVQQAFDQVFAELRFPAARTPAEYGEFLTAIEEVRATLEIFQPEVYDQPLESLVAATAPARARAAGPRMSLIERWRLRRQARGLLRPGTPPADLHAVLAAAQRQRNTWASMAGAGGRPQIPADLDEAHVAYASLHDDLGWLGLLLETTAGGGDLLHTDLAALRVRLERLAEHPERLAVVPAVLGTLDALRGAGLGPLVDDLAARGVALDDVREELTFLWWTSIVEHIAETDPSYAGPHGDELRAVAAEFADADRARVADGAALVRRAVVDRRAAAREEHPDEVEHLLAASRDPSGTVRGVLAGAPHVVPALRPCWAMSPLLAGTHIPPGEWFDVVVIDQAGQLPTAEVLSALGRGRQVVAVGDEHQLAPRAFTTTVADEPPAQPSPAAPSVLDDLGAFLGRRGLRWDHRHLDERLASWANEHVYHRSVQTVPGTEPGAVVRLEKVDGRGAVDTEDGVVETTTAEVDRVVALALEHGGAAPHLSLGIVTLTGAQAGAVEVALRAALAEHEGLAAYFDENRPEPVFVKPVDRCQGDERDVVIVSTGYGRTAHGRVLHRFGPVSADGGERALTVALTRSRYRTVVVSALTAEEMDPERLKGRGPALLRAALEWAERGGTPSPATGPADRGRRELGVLEGDLATRLRQSGLVVHEGLGQGDRPIALAVEDPAGSGRLLVAIESDGPAYASTQSIRERDRLRIDALRRRGWHHVRVWSTDLFRDPTREETRVLAAVHRAGIAEAGRDE